MSGGKRGHERERERERERDPTVDGGPSRPITTVTWTVALWRPCQTFETGLVQRRNTPALTRQRDGGRRRAGETRHSATPGGETPSSGGGVARHRWELDRWAVCVQRATPRHAPGGAVALPREQTGRRDGRA